MSIKRACFQDWKEIRRGRALDLKQGGWKRKDIADALGVTPGAVSQWPTTQIVTGLRSVPSVLSDAIFNSSAVPILVSSWLVHAVN